MPRPAIYLSTCGVIDLRSSDVVHHLYNKILAVAEERHRSIADRRLHMFIMNFISGHIIGFDEYMNLVLDEAAEVHLKRKTMKKVGRIMLKGDNISLIQSAEEK